MGVARLDCAYLELARRVTVVMIMFCNQSFKLDKRVQCLVLSGLFCSLMLSVVALRADDSGLKFKQDPLLQDLLAKRAARKKQEQQQAPQSNATSQPQSSSKKDSARANNTTAGSAKSGGIGQSLIKIESKKQHGAKAAAKASPSGTAGAAKKSAAERAASSPAASESSSGSSLYSSEQLQKFEQASEWIKPRAQMKQTSKRRAKSNQRPLPRSAPNWKEQAKSLGSNRQSSSKSPRDRQESALHKEDAGGQAKQLSTNKSIENSLQSPAADNQAVAGGDEKLPRDSNLSSPSQQTRSRSAGIMLDSASNSDTPAARSSTSGLASELGLPADAESGMQGEITLEAIKAAIKKESQSAADGGVDARAGSSGIGLDKVSQAPVSLQTNTSLSDNAADQADKADAAQVNKDIRDSDAKLDSVTSASPTYVAPKNEPVAVAWHRERAQEGDVEAQYNLAVIYATGFGVAQDYKSAAWWFAKASEHKNAQAQLRLGMLYIIGLGVERSIIKGTSLIQDAAAQGVPLARVINDKLLAKPIDGLDIPRAMRKVREIYLKKNEQAASDGLLKIVARAEIDAETNRKAERFNGQVTGSAAKRGTVGNHIPSFLVPSKPQTEIIIGDPIARIRRHAKEGNVDAEFEWARRLDNGNGVARDRVQALTWYSKAASKNHSGALYYLAIAHLYGIGIPANVTKGREMLKQAAALKQPIAQKLLFYLSDGKNELIADNSSVALAWNLDLAMNENDPDAMSALGHIFNMGWGVKQNSDEGQTWLRKARAAGGKGADRELRRMKIEKIMESRSSKRSEPAAQAPQDIKPLETSSSTQAPELDVAAAVPAATTDTNTPGNAVTDKAAVAAPIMLASAQAASAEENTANVKVRRGTLPSNSPAAKKAQALADKTRASSQPLIKRPPKNEDPGFWSKVKERMTNLFRHDDDPFKPVFLIVMGGLIGLAVFKSLRNRDLRKYRQAQTREQSPF